MKVLLVRPFLDSFGTLRSIGGLYEPVNLMALGAWLRRAGHEIRLVDYEVDPGRLESLGAELAREPVDVVGITAMTPSYEAARRVAARVKAHAPDLPVVLGGVHASLLPGEVLQETPEVDYVVRGEGEETITALLAALPAPSPEALAAIDGVSFRRGEEVIHAPPRALLPDLGVLPHPDRSLIDRARYRGALSPGLYRDADHRFAEIFTSRGCPYRCAFCSVRHVMGRRWRTRPLSDVLAEVDEVMGRDGANFILFHDDNLTVDRERTRALCAALRPRRVRWACLSRVDTVDDVLLGEMAAAGCARIYFGVESGSPRVLRDIGKAITPEQSVRAFALARKHRIVTQAYVTVGQPSETPADLRQTMALLGRLRPDFLFVSIVVPYPGTAHYEDALAKGYLRPGDWSRFLYFDRPVARTDHLSCAELDAWQKRILARYYLHPRYLWSRLRGLRGTDDLRYYARAGVAFLRYVGTRPLASLGR